MDAFYLWSEMGCGAKWELQFKSHLETTFVDTQAGSTCPCAAQLPRGLVRPSVWWRRRIQKETTLMRLRKHRLHWHHCKA